MEKEKDNNKEFKQTRLIIVLIAIIVVLVFALGFLLGTNSNNTLIQSKEKTEEKTEEKHEEKHEEKEENKEEDKKQEIDDNNEQELVKKAYDIIPKSMDTSLAFYRGTKINLLDLSPEDKLSWILSVLPLPKGEKIPVCNNEEDLAISEEEIIKNSLFEDNSFLEYIKNNFKKYKQYTFSSNYGTKSKGHSTIYATYENGNYYVGNSNCDGRGTGPVAFEEFAYDSYKIENDKLYLKVRFAYLDPFIPDDWDGIESLKYNIYDSYEEDAKLIYKEYAVDKFDFELDENNSVLYQFTFKIKGEKLYPLIVEKL